MAGLHIVGARGRMGSEMVRRAQLADVVLVDDLDEADVVALAVPRRAAVGLLERGFGRRTVIDLSGALKRAGTGRYGMLLAGDRLLDGAPPRRGERLSNPGCLASSVILGLRNIGLTDGTRLAGAIHVSMVGGETMAPHGQTGQMRMARRLYDHPHVQEIQQALPGAVIGGFAPMISYGQPRGILTMISGRLRRDRVDPSALPPGEELLDVESVLQTAGIRHRLVLGPVSEAQPFTLGVVLDNLTFPADNAVRLAANLLRQVTVE